MNKNVLITGASGNMGLAMVKKFLEEGYHVVGTKLPAERISDFQNHENFECLDIDLSEEKGVELAIDHCHQYKRDLDVAIFTVGGFAMGSLEETGKEELEQMISLNFYISYFSAKAAFRHMKKHGKGGRIFLVGAKPALNPASGTAMVAYTLSKSLIPNLAEILNEEGKAHGIVSSVIVPSIIDTARNREGMPDADFSKWVTPEQIAEATYFYASEKGSALRSPILKIYGDS
ncbi:MAG: SDR family NAD(P)-dependent oxidoreductase [Bacteroidia bacterium]|nr:SDR family NAD(P)-dependent oxidoreductase [Bacteroidia bacterium]